MNNKISISEIRNLFIKYFIYNNHNFISSNSIISTYKDLLFVNSGMSSFKELFYKNNLNFFNIVNNQKCLRVNGKYNDINNIDVFDRYNTFFEMLGNFSFGHYFKNEAIYMAYTFLTNKNYLSLDINKLIITIYYTDLESENIWLKLGIKKFNIVKIYDKDNIKYNSDNFWKISYFGLCGPCTEIYYDFGDMYYGNFPGYGNIGNRYLEIWNLVFIQYSMDDKNNIELLKYKSVDTGMGLERIVSVLQNVNSNYKIDLFINLINIIKEELYSYKFNKIFINNINKNFFKIISDHTRSIIFIINENIIPSNKKHGYILRKLIRRSYYNIMSLGIKEPFLYKLIKKFIYILYNYYNIELLNIKNLDYVEDIVLKEEINFINIIKKGLIILKKKYKNNNYYLSKSIIEDLYNTYGLPIEIIIDYCKNNNFKFD